MYKGWVFGTRVVNIFSPGQVYTKGKRNSYKCMHIGWVFGTRVVNILNFIVHTLIQFPYIHTQYRSVCTFPVNFT